MFLYFLCRPPVGWGVDILFYCCRHRRHTNYEGTPCSNFLGGMFFVPRSLSIDFCYDLDIWAQGQPMRAFFCHNLFFHSLIKNTRGILIKHGRKLHRHLAHDYVIVHLELTYIYYYYYYCGNLYSAIFRLMLYGASQRIIL